MHILQYLKRCSPLTKYNKKLIIIRCTSTGDSDDKKKDVDKKIDEKRSEEARKKLNELLVSMAQEDFTTTSKTPLNLAKPINRRQKRKGEEGVETVEIKSTEKKMVEAVKNVAESIGGDIKKTESELLLRLLKPMDDDKELNGTSLTDIVKGMKIDREQKSPQSRAEQVRQTLQRVRPAEIDGKIESSQRKLQRKLRVIKPQTVTEKIDLFGSEPLGIFSADDQSLTEGIPNKTWNALYERELKLTVTHPPSNYFQEQILWTEQGKIWKFPIDNEQGLEEEKNVYFAEHVFLEKHLEPWCPPKGPLRHFMELVCVGLSKNPYLTVQAKKDHIKWFENYFAEKKKLLEDVGALGSDQIQTKSIEK